MESSGSTAAARERLLAINGIGPETADSMLLYAGGHGSFVIDAYTKRIFHRHQWCDAAAGYDVIPVPVYYPEVTEILGKPVVRKLADIGRPIDMVNVFRKPSDIPAHVDDIIAAKPKSVWFQLGIRNDEAAQKLAEAGIKVVQDRCLMVEEGRIRR